MVNLKCTHRLPARHTSSPEPQNLLRPPEATVSFSARSSALQPGQPTLTASIPHFPVEKLVPFSQLVGRQLWLCLHGLRRRRLWPWSAKVACHESPARSACREASGSVVAGRRCRCCLLCWLVRRAARRGPRFMHCRLPDEPPLRGLVVSVRRRSLLGAVRRVDVPRRPSLVKALNRFALVDALWVPWARLLEVLKSL